MQRELIHDIETAKPLYLIDVHLPTSWAATINSDQEIVHWSRDYEAIHYDLVGKVVPRDHGHADFLWGPDAATKEKDAWMTILVFKRKPS
jgi:hypothetical protein